MTGSPTPRLDLVTILDLKQLLERNLLELEQLWLLYPVGIAILDLVVAAVLDPGFGSNIAVAILDPAALLVAATTIDCDCSLRDPALRWRRLWWLRLLDPAMWLQFWIRHCACGPWIRLRLLRFLDPVARAILDPAIAVVFVG